METRIAWIDSIKGIACIMIFTHHFLLAFLPATYYGNEVCSHCRYDVFLSNFPAAFVINGDFMVFIFILISNFLVAILALKHQCERDYIAAAMVKRYLRFVITIFLLGVLVFAFQRLHIFGMEKAGEISQSPWLNALYSQKLTIKDLFVIPFFKVLFQSDGTISTALWMLCYIFIGSYISWMLSIISSKGKEIGIIACIVLLAAFGIQREYFLCMAPIGVLLAVLYNRKGFLWEYHKIGIFIAWIIGLVGCYLGGYPSCGSVKPGVWYSWTKDDIRWNHMIGAILSFFSIAYVFKYHEKGEKESTGIGQILQKIGHISYEVYLLHIPLIGTLSSHFLILLNKVQKGYIWAVLLDYIISICALLLLSGLVKSMISKTIDKVIKIFLLKTGFLVEKAQR